MFTKQVDFYNNAVANIGNITVVKHTISLIILSFFFLPPLKIFGMGIRIDDFLLLVITPLLLIYKHKIMNKPFIIIMFLLLLSMLLSKWHGYIFLDVPTSSRDTNEIIRLSKPLLFSILLYYIHIDKLKLFTYKVLYYGSIYIIIIGFLQYFNPLGIGTILSNIYTSDSQINTALYAQTKRITLTGAGPNDGAIIAAYFLLFNYFSYLYTKRKVYLGLFFGMFSVVLFTSSRTVLLGILITLSINILFSKKVNLYLKIIVTIIMMMIVIYILPYFSYIYDGFMLAIEGKNTSLIKRFEHWENAYYLFEQSKLFGWGPAKAIHSTIVDGEYFLFLRRFGILGISILLLLILFPIGYIFKIKKLKSVELNILYSTLVYFIPIAGIVMMTNNYFSGYQTFLPFILLLVVTSRLLEKELQNEKNSKSSF